MKNFGQIFESILNEERLYSFKDNEQRTLSMINNAIEHTFSKESICFKLLGNSLRDFICKNEGYQNGSDEFFHVDERVNLVILNLSNSEKKVISKEIGSLYLEKITKTIRSHIEQLITDNIDDDVVALCKPQLKEIKYSEYNTIDEIILSYEGGDILEYRPILHLTFKDMVYLESECTVKNNMDIIEHYMGEIVKYTPVFGKFAKDIILAL